MEGTLSWPLERAASQFGDNEALVQGDARRTWRDVAERVARLGAGLADLGIGPGDRVAVLAANDSRYFELAHAIPRSGAVLNALNTRLAAAELEWILADSEPGVLVCDDTNLTLARQLRERCDSVHELVRLRTASDGANDEVPFDELLARGEAAPVDVAPTALATISYTGGTTGRPKGVMLSHGNLLANAKHMLAALPLHETDRYLHTPPMFHAADAMMMFCLTWVGGAHVVIPGFDPELVPATIEREQITVTVLVPTMINMVLGHAAARTRDLSSLRLLLYGASPMPDDLRRRAMEVFRCEWAQLYGMTEAAPVVSVLSPSTHRRGAHGEEPFATRLRSAGTPVVGVEAEIRRADGTRAAVGEPGEVVVRGPNIMLGYWNRPEETKAALAGGWYHTGDVAFADDAGHLFIVDRTNDMIISGGENVYSSEVENVLCSHPGVDEAAVIGVPDDLWGERVHAIVVPRPATDLDEAEVREHCRLRLAGFKVPRSVEIRTDALPKSAAGKILKRDLRAPYWAGRTRMV